jgi:hypothetical protein
MWRFDMSDRVYRTVLRLAGKIGNEISASTAIE